MAVALFEVVYWRSLALSESLKGNSDHSTLRHLIDAARQVLAHVEHAIQNQWGFYVDHTKPWQTYVLPTWHTPTAGLWKNGPLLWLHLPVSQLKC